MHRHRIQSKLTYDKDNNVRAILKLLCSYFRTRFLVTWYVPFLVIYSQFLHSRICMRFQIVFCWRETEWFVVEGQKAGVKYYLVIDSSILLLSTTHHYLLCYNIIFVCINIVFVCIKIIFVCIVFIKYYLVIDPSILALSAMHHYLPYCICVGACKLYLYALKLHL